MLRKQVSKAAVVILAAAGAVLAQVQPVQPHVKTLEKRGPEEGALPVVAAPAAAAPKAAPADYVLGADDQIALWTPEAEELNTKTARVEGNGNVTIPLIGGVKAAGLTPTELGKEIATKLEKYYVKPQVVVSVTEYRSQPVSVFGAVNTPGVHQVQGRKTLVEMLSLAGGPKPEAGPMVIVQRRAEWGPIPVENAKTDPSGQYSIAEIDLKAITTTERPQDNIAIKPHDVINVPKAKLVYVIGEVERAGGFVLSDRGGLSVLQALSMAGGPKGTASPKNARILRRDEANPTQGIAVNLSAILQGKDKDFDLQPEDVLWIPDSRPKKALARAAEAALQTVTGVAIWRVGQR